MTPIGVTYYFHSKKLNRQYGRWYEKRVGERTVPYSRQQECDDAAAQWVADADAGMRRVTTSLRYDALAFDGTGARVSGETR